MKACLKNEHIKRLKISNIPLTNTLVHPSQIYHYIYICILHILTYIYVFVFLLAVFRSLRFFCYHMVVIINLSSFFISRLFLLQFFLIHYPVETLIIKIFIKLPYLSVYIVYDKFSYTSYYIHIFFYNLV